MNSSASISTEPERIVKYILWLLIAAFVVLVAYTFFKGHYFIIHEDEALYYNSGRLFHETGSVTASECNEETLAPIWNSGCYGPIYNVFYGVVAKLVGFHAFSFIVINLLCITLITYLIFRAGFTNQVKLFIACSLFSSYVFVAYAFTFFPETIILLFSVILSLQLKSIYDKIVANEESGSRIALFLVSVLCFSVFRVTMVFWAFGLMAFSKSFKDFLKYAAFAAICFVPVYFFIKYFTAPLYGTPIGSIDKSGMAIVLMHINTFFKNVVRYFTINPKYDFLIVALFLFAVYNWISLKNRLILCACIIASLYFLVLLTLYTPYYFFFDKQSACIFPLLLITLFYTIPLRRKIILLAVMVLFSPIAYAKAYSQVKQHKASFIQNDNLKPVIDQLSNIRDKMEGTKSRTILIQYHEFDSIIPFYLFMGNIPVSTKDGYPVTITENYSSDNKVAYEDNFRTHGKMYVDYFLSKKPLNIDSTALVLQNGLFYFYKNLKKIK